MIVEVRSDHDTREASDGMDEGKRIKTSHDSSFTEAPWQEMYEVSRAVTTHVPIIIQMYARSVVKRDRPSRS